MEAPGWEADWEDEFSQWLLSVGSNSPVSTAPPSGQAADRTADEASQAMVDEIVAARRAENLAVWRQVAAVSDLLKTWRGADNARRGTDPDADADPDPRADLIPASVVAEVALACAMSEYAVARRLDAAAALITESRLPATATLLENGLADWPKVQVMVRETAVLAAEAAVAVDAVVAPLISDVNVPRLTQAVRAAIATVDPVGYAARCGEASRRRSVGTRAAEDGMGEIVVWAPMQAVVAVQARLDDAVARARAAGDPRSAGEVRCDELISRVTGDSWTVSGPVAAAPPAGPPSPRLTVTLTMTLSAWLGMRDDPATMAGTHLLPAGLARDLAARMATDATWRCAVVDDEHGTLLGLGRATRTTRYTPSPRLAEFARTAEPLCTFPGCGTRAARCDLDHRVPHPTGSTCTCNLQTLCRRHHRLKTAGRIGSSIVTAAGPVPGTVEWITPSGRRYERHPTSIAPPERGAVTGLRAPPTCDGAAGDGATGRLDPPPF